MKKFLICLIILLSGCSANHFNNSDMDYINSDYNKGAYINEQIFISNKNKVCIGVLLPLEGQYKDVSYNIIEAIQLAYSNSSNKQHIVIRFYNTFSDGKDITLNAVKNAVDSGVDVIVGPLFATNLQQISKITAKKNIPVISFSNDRTALIDTKNVYLAGFSPEIEVERVVDYVANTQHATRFAALIPENKYGKIILSSLKATIEARGLKLVKVVTYPTDTVNFTPFITQLIEPSELDRYESAVQAYKVKYAHEASHSLVKVKDYPQLNLDFDTLFIGDTSSRLMLLGVHIPYVGINVNKINVIGTRLISGITLQNEQVFNNVIYPDFPNLQNTIFASKFSSIFKTKPALISASAYDIIQMLTNLVVVEESNNVIRFDFYKDSLVNQNIYGVLGSFSLRKDGLIVRDMEIKSINGKNYTVIDNNINLDFVAVDNYRNIAGF